MLALKNFQEQSLAKLQAYLSKVGAMGADTAFYDMTHRAYRAVPQLPGLPYVCLRVPTGGGKTLMACHALGIVAKEYLQQERAVCLWLVPSNVIREQTIKALQNPQHPYRQAVADQVGGNVRVMDLAEAPHVQRDHLEHDTCIIVSTLASLRVEDTEGRKIYENSEDLDPHFAGLPAGIEAKLERNGGGSIPHSLANVLRMWGPMVVMDEAHNARTKLSFDALAHFAPSCIIEFTATPQAIHNPSGGLYASNILAHVSAAELKTEEMIKLPVKLRVRSEWKEAVGDALHTQRELEAVAKEEEQQTGEYIRPIVLLQAQPHREGQEMLTVEVVKKALLDDFKVPADQVAVATGEIRGIEGVDLFDRGCPVRFIITQQALKEGWDCSFAYILCSVADIGSSRYVEQLLGRVLRMPKAHKKKHSPLNCAYAVVSSSKFNETLGELREAIIENGFERIEAETYVSGEQGGLFGAGSLFAQVSEKVPEKPDLSKLAGPLRERVVYDESAGTLIVSGVVTATEKAALETCFTTPQAKKVVERIYNISRGRSASGDEASGVGPLRVPALSIRVDGQLELFDESHFLDEAWDLATCDAGISEQEFPSQVVMGTDGEVDVTEAGKIEARFIDQVRQQLALLRSEPGWSLAGLVNWLDRQIAHPDITRTQSTLFIYNALTGLMESRHVTPEQLAREKFRLRTALAVKIDQYRLEMAKASFQRRLFGEGAGEIEVSPERCFIIAQDSYSPNWYYEPGYRFNKHAFPLVGELKSDGEEFECARFIDQTDQVKRWVRNVERQPSSFWLQTSTDKFYPDFLAELVDGRILVVEYKGEDRWSNDDSREKRAVGELWADRSGGCCLFVMPKGNDLPAIVSALEGHVGR
ncbi:MAG: DEAD/DEAH box helicase family protein [Planctomycetota bacterium]|nr:DEAD/DEAH box helicase family protein [Planctomycetota bacterium]